MKTVLAYVRVASGYKAVSVPAAFLQSLTYLGCTSQPDTGAPIITVYHGRNNSHLGFGAFR